MGSFREDMLGPQAQEAIVIRANAEIVLVERLRDLVQKKAKADAAYAASLAKIAATAPMAPALDSSPLQDAWTAMVEEMDKVAKALTRSTEDAQGSLLSSLDDLVRAKREARDGFQANRLGVQRELTRRAETARRLRKEYGEAAERTNHLRAKFQASHVATQTLAVHGKLPPGSEYDAKQFGKRTDKLMLNLHNDYVFSVESANIFTEYCQEQIVPALLGSFQSQLELQVADLREVLQHCLRLSDPKAFVDAFAALRVRIDSIDRSSEYAGFIRNNAQPPPELAMMCYERAPEDLYNPAGWGATNGAPAEGEEPELYVTNLTMPSLLERMAAAKTRLDDLEAEQAAKMTEISKIEQQAQTQESLGASGQEADPIASAKRVWADRARSLALQLEFDLALLHCAKEGAVYEYDMLQWVVDELDDNRPVKFIATVLATASPILSAEELAAATSAAGASHGSNSVATAAARVVGIVKPRLRRWKEHEGSKDRADRKPSPLTTAPSFFGKLKQTVASSALLQGSSSSASMNDHQTIRRQSSGGAAGETAGRSGRRVSTQLSNDNLSGQRGGDAPLPPTPPTATPSPPSQRKASPMLPPSTVAAWPAGGAGAPASAGPSAQAPSARAPSAQGPPVARKPTGRQGACRPRRSAESRMRELERQTWYHGDVARKSADALLQLNGDFLVRESSTKQGQFVITVRWGLVKHVIIPQDEEGMYRLEDYPFESVPELIEYYLRERKVLTKHSQAILERGIPSEKYRWDLPRADVALGKELGSGHFGKVYQAHLVSSGREVAVKCCRPDQMDKERFLQEAEILKQYSHPNIVALVGVCLPEAPDDPVYIVTELMAGGDFLRFLRSPHGTTASQEELLRFAVHAAAGMEYLESKRCIHRDLAARNCLVGKSNVLKISDFGMSRMVAEDDGIYTITEKRAVPIKWTSPESLNMGTYTSKSDVWSYGVLLWEIYTRGQPPYQGLSNKETREKIEEGYRMPVPEGMLEGVAELMGECWQYEPSDRPTFAEIYARLEAYMYMFDTSAVYE